MIKQPSNSKLCGHCCLATILDISLEESIKLIKHTKGTKTKELTKYFNHSSLKIGIPTSKSLCIARPITRIRGRWHWVLYKEGIIYDPILGGTITIEEFYWLDMYISSYIPII